MNGRWLFIGCLVAASGCSALDDIHDDSVQEVSIREFDSPMMVIPDVPAGMRPLAEVMFNEANELVDATKIFVPKNLAGVCEAVGSTPRASRTIVTSPRVDIQSCEDDQRFFVGVDANNRPTWIRASETSRDDEVLSASPSAIVFRQTASVTLQVVNPTTGDLMLPKPFSLPAAAWDNGEFLEGATFDPVSQAFYWGAINLSGFKNEFFHRTTVSTGATGDLLQIPNIGNDGQPATTGKYVLSSDQKRLLMSLQSSSRASYFGCGIVDLARNRFVFRKDIGAAFCRPVVGRDNHVGFWYDAHGKRVLEHYVVQ
jgi:hypothetical protein